MPSIAADDEVSADGKRAVRRIGPQPDDAAVLHDQIGRLRLHAQVERLVAFALAGEKIEKIPLRHQRDIFAVRRQMGEITHDQPVLADLAAELFDFLVRQFQKIVEQPELIHELQRRGMNSIAAKIAKKVGMLFQHHDLDAGAGQEKPEHHACRATAGDTAFRGQRQFRHCDTLR